MQKTSLQNYKKNSFIIYIMVLSLIITTAKGLRLGSNIGPGEIIALLTSMYLILSNKGKINNKTILYTLLFWMSIIFLLMAGLFIRTNFYSMPNPFPRTLIAYLFSSIICYGLYSGTILSEEIELTQEIFLKIIGVITSIFFILIISNTRTIAGLNLYWLGTNRFQGWSLDPNQFTIPFIIVPFLIINYLVSNGKSTKIRIGMFLLLAMNVFVGLATGSDSLIASWLIGFGTTVLYLVFKKIFIKRKLRLLHILIIIPILFSSFMFLILNYNKIIDVVVDFLMKDGQLETRLNIWMDSIDIIKLSPIVGLGPDVGRDLGKANIMGESHNNILHLGMSTGLLGILALLLYYGYIFKTILKSQNIYLLGGFLSLFTFGITHYTLRHPMYWFMLLLVNGLAVNERLNTQESG